MNIKDFIIEKLDPNMNNLIKVILEDNVVKLMNTHDLKKYLCHKKMNISMLNFDSKRYIEVKLEKFNILINLYESAYDSSIAFMFNINDQKIIMKHYYTSNRLDYIQYKSDNNKGVNEITFGIEEGNIFYKGIDDIDIEKKINVQLLELIMNNLDSKEIKDLININLDMDLTVKNIRNIILESLIEDLSQINLILNDKKNIIPKNK